MSKNREIWITGFALFALFFGAGNLILPPFLGVNSQRFLTMGANGFDGICIVENGMSRSRHLVNHLEKP